MFIVQPRFSFGTLINEELDSKKHGQRRWQNFELATAWLNRRGAEKVRRSAQSFLADGGAVQATVGVDFGGTTYEALDIFLDLESEGANIVTHIFHDESPHSTFHPKMFLFSNAACARLFLGSNNLTGAGLYSNVEAAVRITRSIDHGLIRDAQIALASWRNESADTKPQRLTAQLLERLLDYGYVPTEEQLRASRAPSSQSSRSRDKQIFGRSRIEVAESEPAEPGKASAVEDAVNVEPVQSMLMRVRPRRNGRQLQISMSILQGSFMNDVDEVFSAHDGSRRRVGYDHVVRDGKRIANLARFEAPEMEGMQNPVAQFRWVKSSEETNESSWILQYEIFDANSSEKGAKIFERLENGIRTPPATNLKRLGHSETVLSKPQPQIAQWYRLDFL